MPTKEQIQARRTRYYLQTMVERAQDRLHQEVDKAFWEALRVLGIAQDEHRIFPRPSRYFRKEPKKK